LTDGNFDKKQYYFTKMKFPATLILVISACGFILLNEIPGVTGRNTTEMAIGIITPS